MCKILAPRTGSFLHGCLACCCWGLAHPCTSPLYPNYFFWPVILALGVTRGISLKNVFEKGYISRLKTFLSIYNSTIRDLVLWDLHEPLEKQQYPLKGWDLQPLSIYNPKELNRLASPPPSHRENEIQDRYCVVVLIRKGSLGCGWGALNERLGLHILHISPWSFLFLSFPHLVLPLFLLPRFICVLTVYVCYSCVCKWPYVSWHWFV